MVSGMVKTSRRQLTCHVLQENGLLSLRPAEVRETITANSVKRLGHHTPSTKSGSCQPMGKRKIPAPTATNRMGEVIMCHWSTKRGTSTATRNTVAANNNPRSYKSVWKNPGLALRKNSCASYKSCPSFIEFESYPSPSFYSFVRSLLAPAYSPAPSGVAPANPATPQLETSRHGINSIYEFRFSNFTPYSMEMRNPCQTSISLLLSSRNSRNTMKVMR